MASAASELAPTDVTKHLKGVQFPAKKNDLIERARDNDADDNVIAAIEEMPEEEYQDMADVMRGFGAAQP